MNKPSLNEEQILALLCQSDEEENDDLDEITRCTQLQGQTLQLQGQTQGQTLPTEDYAIL